jgi:hypothetical protein
MAKKNERARPRSHSRKNLFPRSRSCRFRTVRTASLHAKLRGHNGSHGTAYNKKEATYLLAGLNVPAFIARTSKCHNRKSLP